MTRHNIVKDPDLEFGIMAQEKHYEIASNDPVLHNSELANYYKDQGNEEMALYHMKIAEVAIKLTIAGMMGGTSQSGNEEKKPPIVSPQMETGRVAQEPQNMGGM